MCGPFAHACFAAVPPLRIRVAHLNEFADYYTRLARMESEAKKDQEMEQ